MASTTVQTINTGADKLKLAASGLLLLAGLASYFYLASMGAWVQWGGFLSALVLAVALFFISEPGKQLIGFLKDTWREVKKVVWPTRKESTQMTLVVFGFVIVMALFLWLTDKSLEWLFYDLILGWKK